MSKHAILSPSGFKALMLCPAKPAMEQGLPDERSEYADEGTAAHFLGSTCLELCENATAYLGRSVFVSEAFTGWIAQAPAEALNTGRAFKVNAEMVDAVQVYLTTVRDRVAAYELLGASVELHVEQSLPIGHITGEDGAEGTGDAVIIAAFPDGHAVIEVGDLKYGKGVEVDAFDNPQLKMYGLGAMEKFGLVYDFTEVVTWISQPRINIQASECKYTAEEILKWSAEASQAAATAYGLLNYGNEGIDVDFHCKPHPDACRFCKAKGHCGALAKGVETALSAEFTDLTTADKVEKDAIVDRLVKAAPVDVLGAKMDAVELVEMWCKAIRARVESQLLAGVPVAGYKLVQGKRGNRAWTDAEDAEAMLKGMRLKKEEMYEFKVISPTTAETVLKASPKRWAKVVKLITQSDGKPSVAPISDKRASLEIKPVESEFTVITEPQGAEDLV
jgi:hypothetical protein